MDVTSLIYAHPCTRMTLMELMECIYQLKGKGKGKLLGRSPNSSVSVIPTCPSQHPFRLAGSPTP